MITYSLRNFANKTQYDTLLDCVLIAYTYMMKSITLSNGMIGGFGKVTEVVIVGSNKLLKSLLKVRNYKNYGSRE